MLHLLNPWDHRNVLLLAQMVLNLPLVVRYQIAQCWYLISSDFNSSSLLSIWLLFVSTMHLYTIKKYMYTISCHLILNTISTVLSSCQTISSDVIARCILFENAALLAELSYTKSLPTILTIFVFDYSTIGWTSQNISLAKHECSLRWTQSS